MIRLIGRMVQVVRYLVIAAVILVGLPWAAVHFVGWPLPRAVPDPVTLRDWIDHPMSGMRFWKGVSIIFWVAWGTLIVYLVIDVLAQLGRIRPPRIRIRPLQGLAAGMVGATVATVSSGTGHAAPPAVVAPATVPTVDPADATAAGPTYVVERGDWLSAIAARFLGDQDAHPRIQELNPNLEARDTRFPNHIEAGWAILLPADAHDRGIRLHAAGALRQPPSPPPVAPPQAMPPPDPAPPPTPTSRTGTDEPTPTATAAVPPSADAAAEPDGQLDGDGDGHPDVIVGQSTTGAMAGAGLLASLLFALLTAERRRQRGLYAAGQEPPRPANGRAERELRAAQQPADVERLDTALRSFSHGMADRAVLPDVVGVRLVGGDVQVLLGQPADDPPPPWLDEGTQWALPAYLQPSTAGSPATLLPTLVTIGSRAGRHLLIDLERLGTLSIGGHPYRARDLLRHIACELACNTWSDNAAIILAGFGSETDTMTEIGPDRIVTADSASTAIATVRAELARRASNGTTAPAMVLLVASPDAATRTALVDLHQTLTVTGRCGIAVVTTVADSAPIGPAMLTITDTGLLRAQLPGLRLSTDAATVPIDMLEPMAAAFRAAHLAPAVEPASPAGELPPWDDTIDPTHGALALFDPAPPETSTTNTPAGRHRHGHASARPARARPARCRPCRLARRHHQPATGRHPRPDRSPHARQAHRQPTPPLHRDAALPTHPPHPQRRPGHHRKRPLVRPPRR